MVIEGSEFKINVNVLPIDGVHLSDCDFECVFYVYPNRTKVVRKSEMKKVDDDNYVAMLDSRGLGVGTVRMVISVHIPDSDFPDNIRTEIAQVCTGIVLEKAPVSLLG